MPVHKKPRNSIFISDSKPVEGRVLDNDEAVSGAEKMVCGQLTDFKMSLLFIIVTSLKGGGGIRSNWG